MKIGYAHEFGYWGGLGPEVYKKAMLGGGETGLIKCAVGLAEKGHEVVVFGKCEQEGKHGGVTWLNKGKLDGDWQEYDAFIACENADLLVGRKAKFRILDFMCNHLQGQDTSCIDMFVGRSDWHVEVLKTNSPILRNIPSQVFWAGVDPNRYGDKIKKEKYRVFYSSSPDRGLHHLLRFWPKVMDKIPKANLYVYYEVEKYFEQCKWRMDDQGEHAWDIHHGLKQPGVHFVGPVNQYVLAKEQQKAQLMCYPCDTVIPTEGFSMSVGEAFLADCAVLTSDCDCFPEIWGDVVALLPLPIDDCMWADSIVEILTNKELQKKYNKAGKEKVLTDYNWDTIVNKWDKFLRAMV